ncbi:hypothetical protein ACFL6M_04895, partial [Candidatus Eisenbacteria bacterium]
MRMARLFAVLLVVSTPMIARADLTPIYDIQYTTDPSGNSPLNGQTITTSGIVTMVYFNGFVIAEATGPWHAVNVRTLSYGPQVGDEIEVTGTVSESNNMTK